MRYRSAPEGHQRAGRTGGGSRTGAVADPASFLAALQRSAGNRTVSLWLQSAAVLAQQRTLPVQRFSEQNNVEHTFEGGAVIDHTTELVLRADRLNKPSGTDLGKLAANADKQIPPKKKNGAATWRAGTNTGISLMANDERIPKEKKTQVVLFVPETLQIRQTGPADHAEFHTTVELSATQIGSELQNVKLVDRFHEEVIQRS